MHPRHPNANPKCKECDGYGYIHIDDVQVEVQSIEHYTEYAYDPIYTECHCTETITEKELDETSYRTAPNHF